MKKIYSYLALILGVLVLIACQPTSQSTTSPTQGINQISSLSSQARGSSTASRASASTSVVQDVSDLRDTDYFNDHALEHIFLGTINRKGQATGYHYQGLASQAKIIESTKSKADKHGVYRARVEIDGIEKSATSTFFPESWAPQEVVDAINEAYENKEHVSGNIYQGSSRDIQIQMYLTDDDLIISAFPIYER